MRRFFCKRVLGKWSNTSRLVSSVSIDTFFQCSQHFTYIYVRKIIYNSLKFERKYLLTTKDLTTEFLLYHESIFRQLSGKKKFKSLARFYLEILTILAVWRTKQENGQIDHVWCLLFSIDTFFQCSKNTTRKIESSLRASQSATLLLVWSVYHFFPEGTQ